MEIRRVSTFAIVAALLTAAWPTLGQEAQRPRVVLTNCHVIDCTGNTLMKNMTVFIRGERISAVSKGVYTGNRNDPNTRVFDLNGGYVLPGFWNMHSHLSDLLPDVNDILGTEPVLPAAIRAGRNAMDALKRGFTALRMTGERDYIDVAWRDAFDAGVFVGPRMFASGKIVLPTPDRAPDRGWPVGLYADGPDEVRAAMQENINRGADFIKLVVTDLEQDELEAAIETAHANGLRVTAHSGGMGAQRAVEAGVDCIEHGYDLTDKTIQMMAEKGVFYDPTIVCNLSKDYIAEREKIIGELGLDEDPEVIKGRIEVAFADERSQDRAARQRDILKKARDAGVKIIPGGDSNPLGEIGLLEIEQLVFSGLTEMEALIAATRNCADMVGALENLGTVEEGKLADLIVLDGNPLEHISNIRKLKMVFKDGKPVLLEKDEGLTSFWKLYFTRK
jgi:imidazolonepropionase-like amidohydrolase